jgi:hypothetical protein
MSDKSTVGGNPRLFLGTKGKISFSTSAGSAQVFGFLLNLQTCYSYWLCFEIM